MTFHTLPIKPMLATAHESDTLPKGTWIAEEKFNGWRWTAYVGPDMWSSSAVQEKVVHIWTRQGNLDFVPMHIMAALLEMPSGVYDGEKIVAGPRSTSYDVGNHANRPKLQYVLFDVLELLKDDGEAVSVAHLSWKHRRGMLEAAFNVRSDVHNKILGSTGFLALTLSAVHRLTEWSDVEHIVGGIWDDGGEGVILKDVDAPYRVGKRAKTFLKVKSLHSAEVIITGWEAGTTGPQCVAVCIDREGHEVRVKILNDALRARVRTEHQKMIGKTLHIQYQERTPYGGYISPRWERLEGEK